MTKTQLRTIEMFFDTQWTETSTLAFIAQCYITKMKPNNTNKFDMELANI